MVKKHEYLGTKATAWAPLGTRTEIAIYIKEKKGQRYWVERHNEQFNRSQYSWKTLNELKQAIRKLDNITEKGLAYLKLDVEHCPGGFRTSSNRDMCVRESADKLYQFRR